VKANEPVGLGPEESYTRRAVMIRDFHPWVCGYGPRKVADWVRILDFTRG
jgi:hypothetical protein